MRLDPHHIQSRIRALRELRGWTQHELADIANVSQPLISSLENGTRTATFQHVQILAQATGVPERFFVLEVEELTEAQLHFRKRRTAPTKSTRAVVRKFSEARHLAKELAHAYRPKVVLNPVQGAVDNDDIEEIALDVRSALGFGDGPIKHAIRSCERAGFPVVMFDSEDGVAEDHCGVSYTDASGFGVIACRTGQSGDQLRMTVGHELAHRLLHTYRDVPEKQREQEAFRLSGALFLPREVALEELSDSLTLTGYARLKAAWGISIQALIMRAYALGIIDDERRTSLMRQINRRGWRTDEPVEVGVERPALLWHLLDRRFGKATYWRASEELGFAQSDLMEWIPAQAQPAGEGHADVIRLDELARRRAARA
ncbi:helix-turn-helix domain-containing protein [Nocardia puris]|uniref:helix-turn-helix domain-containing protein n=1 Tax=Nocardia puris TaxID=208602 RepID=UPI001894D87B|nr:XRE family transcriptional regulator [Nocardia puris]MBF6213747.1 helix-turn-helix domain-containing protein [Nocardia puris]